MARLPRPALVPALIQLAAWACLSHAALAITPEATRREQTVQHTPPAELLRNYALVACLGRAFPQVGAQSTAAADSYAHFGQAPPEAYQEVIAAADEFLKRDYTSFENKDFGVAKCIDFAKSRPLEQIVQKYIPAPPRGRTGGNGPG